jgi:4-amino-4-deoxy-L-arabinose transferase-like glycosyltransferase
MNYKLILITITLLNFFLPLGFTPLFDLDEGAFSEATREMIESGNYLTTYLNGALRFDKPILIYWLQALSVHTFGLNEFALRLPSAIAASLWAVIIWLFSRRYFDEKVAFYTTLSMLGALQINIIAKAAIADALLNLFIAFTLFSVWVYLESKKSRYLYAAFASIGLGVLTKGPVAILVPLATLFFYMLLKRDIKSFFKIVFNPIGWLLFLSISMPWYILEYLDQGQKFIDGFFLKHNLERFSSSLEHHSGSYLYYIPVLLIGFLPFTTPLVESLFRIKKELKDNLFLYLFIWFGFVFLFFTLSGTKLPHYIIYGYTPLFIFIGHTIAKSQIKVSWLFILPIVILLAILLFFPYFVDYIEAENNYYEALFSAAKEIFGLRFQTITLIVMFSIVVIKFVKLKELLKISLITALFGFYTNLVVIKNYGDVVQAPIKEAALWAKERGVDVIMYHFTRPSFLVYLEKKSLQKKPEVGDFVLTQKNNLPRFKKQSVQYSKNGLYIIRIEK